jgi:hypothetical protein
MPVYREHIMSSIETLKSQAKRLRNHLTAKNLPLSHSQALEAIAAVHEYKDWNTAAAKLQATLAPAKPTIICITADMSIDDVRAEVDECLRADPGYVRFRLDAAASGYQHREAYQVAREIEARGVKADVDSPLSL